MKVSFLIPAYNEGRTIAELIERVSALPFDKELIVVDDGSTDDTPAILGALRAGRDDLIVIRQANRGQGRCAAGGDTAHHRRHRGHPGRRPRVRPGARCESLIEPIVRGVADVVYGSRLSGGRPQRAYLFWHMVGNRFLSLVTGLLFNTTLSDMETGYKAFRADVLKSLDLRADDFAIEPEITAKICRRKLRIYEVPISYYGRSYDEGKKITWRDGFKALWMLVRVRLEP